MRTRTLLSAGALVGGSLTALAATLAAPVALAQEPPPAQEAAPAVAATSTVTLPLLGAPLVVDVSTDVGGGIVDVSLNQADDYTADKLKPNRVSFVNDAGTTRVKVAGHWGGQRVTAAAASLAEITGPGGWTGDVFGDGQTTTVGFSVGATAEGGPDITGVTVDSAATFEIGATEYRDRSWGDATIESANAEISFEQNGQRRSLDVSAVLVTKPDGSKANVVVGISGVRGRALVEGDQVGTHTWTGALCDGTPASVTYTVDADGQVSNVVPTPAGQVNERGDRAWVAFSRREGVAITSNDARWWHDGDDGHGGGDGDEPLAVGTSEWFRCDRVDPTVNTEIDPAATDDGDEGDEGDEGVDGDDRGHDWGGQQDGRDHDGWGDSGDGDGDGRDHGDWGDGEDHGDHGDWGEGRDHGDWGDGRDGRDGGSEGGGGWDRGGDGRRGG